MTEKFRTNRPEELVGTLLKADVALEALIYPKKALNDIVPGEFGIARFRVLKLYSGAIPYSAVRMYGKESEYIITLKGPMARLAKESTYYFEGILQHEEKWGDSYKIVQLSTNFELKTLEDRLVFLVGVVGEPRAQQLIDHFDDIVQKMEDKDAEGLCEYKGIAETTAARLIRLYHKNKTLARAEALLREFGLTQNMVMKLVAAYKSADTVLHILKVNPYLLIDDVDGIGWQKADAIALNNGYAPWGEFRLKAYAKYYLREQANREGHSWVSLDELVQAILQIAPEVQVPDLQDMLRRWTTEKMFHAHAPWLYYDKSSRRIGLTYYRELEARIAQELMRLRNAPVPPYSREDVEDAIRRTEFEQGFEYTDEQREAIYKCLDNQVVIVSGSAGCVDCDTEFFNGVQWKRIADYQKGDKVLQYNPDGTAELVEPIGYVKYPEEKLWRLETTELDMCLSNEHNVYYLDKHDQLRHKSFSEIKRLHETTPAGFDGRFITDKGLVGINTNPKPQIVPYKTLDGYKYCFTVPTHMWIMRRNGKILVTGNTGKTSIMAPVVAYLRSQRKFFSQCSLSGKASSNLSEVTNAEGYTIHRLLGYKPLEGFTFTKDNPLCEDAIILDELSLVGGEIFLSLVQAIKTGAKLIMLGDPNQLEAIGLANLLKDCINSNVFATARLNKIHRQAENSGIITESLRASAGESIVGISPTVEYRGNLKDLKIVSFDDASESYDKIMDEYKALLKQNISPQDITVVVPMRERGRISCLAINNAIQDLVNGTESGDDKHLTLTNGGGHYVLRRGDRIIITHNHYRGCKNAAGRDEAVFNGNTGRIVDFTLQGGLIVDLTQQGRVRIPRGYLPDVELGYALTCHKIQGSSSPYIIVGLDTSAYSMYSKEWIYTALTRARKFCVFVTQISSARASVRISRVKVKRTWLQEMLIALSKSESAGLSLNFSDADLDAFVSNKDEIESLLQKRDGEE